MYSIASPVKHKIKLMVHYGGEPSYMMYEELQLPASVWTVFGDDLADIQAFKTLRLVVVVGRVV